MHHFTDDPTGSTAVGKCQVKEVQQEMAVILGLVGLLSAFAGTSPPYIQPPMNIFFTFPMVGDKNGLVSQ